MAASEKAKPRTRPRTCVIRRSRWLRRRRMRRRRRSTARSGCGRDATGSLVDDRDRADHAEAFLFRLENPLGDEAVARPAISARQPSTQADGDDDQQHAEGDRIVRLPHRPEIRLVGHQRGDRQHRIDVEQHTMAIADRDPQADRRQHPRGHVSGPVERGAVSWLRDPRRELQVGDQVDSAPRGRLDNRVAVAGKFAAVQIPERPRRPQRRRPGSRSTPTGGSGRSRRAQRAPPRRRSSRRRQHRRNRSARRSRTMPRSRRPSPRSRGHRH